MKKQTVDEKRTKFNFMNLIMRAIPALAPVPAMWSVFAAARDKLNWPDPVAAAAALAVEGLGFTSVNLAERMYTHNKSLRLDERAQKLEAPTGKAVTATAFYLIVVVAMIILVDVAPNATVFLPIAFPFLGITGAAVWAMGTEQDDRERIVNEWRAKKQADRLQVQVAGKADKQGQKNDKQPASKGDKLQVQVTSKGDKQGRQVAGARPALPASLAGKDDKQASKQPVQDEALLAYWSDDPKASDGKVAAHFGTSRQAIQQRREKLVRNGEVKMTDAGVAIVGIDISAGALQ